MPLHPTISAGADWTTLARWPCPRDEGFPLRRWPVLANGPLNKQAELVHPSKIKVETVLIDVQNLFERTRWRIQSDSHIRNSFQVQSQTTLSVFLNAHGIEYQLSKRCRLFFGNVNLIFHAKPIKFLKSMENFALLKDYKPCESKYALKTIFLEVSSVIVHYNHKLNMCIISFPDYLMNNIFLIDKEENFLYLHKLKAEESLKKSIPSHVLCRRLGIRGVTLSKITSRIMIIKKPGSNNNTNIGLSMKLSNPSPYSKRVKKIQWLLDV
ncbi:uncharacterized protein VP01_248g4 [Puccinia sorghi]|uniref:Uncharacterized protein n=1 Tax=Puccinia sorghi TaxID=27349 RepID=A0A0L6V6F6_9BASI|nr:uncharacterized protein VP01_248g4 [Puccinia sorghi]